MTQEGEMGEWISVEERLPEESEMYLVYCVDETVQVCLFIGGQWDAPRVRGSSEEFGITHWMPLPSPPSAEKEER